MIMCRFLRAPILERKKWWQKVPVKHAHTYRRLPLEHSGSANKVADIVVIRSHDRSFPLKLKMFLPANKTQKTFSDNKDSKEETAEWETAKAVADVREALLNLGDVMAELWPYDDTPRILHRVLHNYNFAAGLRCSEQEKVRTMVEFCDGILRENACRAVEKEPPLSFREAKERWSDLTERMTPIQTAAQPLNTNSAGRGGRGASASNQARGGFGGGGMAGSVTRGGAAVRGRGARFNTGGSSHAVCFNYNRGNCSRPPKGCGCDDGRGGLFAHVCNFFDMATARFCLLQHPRTGNH